MSEEKTIVDDINRSVYDVIDKEDNATGLEEGLNEDIIRRISEEKDDPDWMREFRLNCLKIYKELKVPQWGPGIDGLDMDHISTYVRPNTRMQTSWDDVPEDIKNTFERLGIPQAERASLAGVGAQYDSELVYHNVMKEVEEQGVVYTDFESALKGEYSTSLTIHHKFTELFKLLFVDGNPAGVKAMLSEMGMIQNVLRLPLVPTRLTTMEKISQIVKELGY